MHQTNTVFLRNVEHLNIGGALRRQIESLQPDGVSWSIGSEGNPSLQISGKPVYQAENAVAFVAREINAFLENHDPDLVVFFGLGLGLHLQFMRLKTEKPILIFEPSLDVLASVLPKVPLVFENVTLITNTGHLIEAAGEILSRTRHKMAVGAITPYRDIFPEAFDSFRKALEQALQNIVINQSTRAEFSIDWINHLGINLPELVGFPPLRALGDVFAGKPGILVGAGPSLDSNMEVLRSAKGHALICAVHTAVMPLAKAGIIPDIVVLVESQHLEYYFEDVQDMDQMILAPAPQTHPTHLHMGFKGVLTVSLDGHPMADWFEKAYGIAGLRSGGSVANTAFSILHNLKCDPLILVGMDTAFTNNRTHASEAETGCCQVEMDPESNSMSFSYSDQRQADGHWDAQMVPAWGGQGEVMTRAVFNSFRHWFEAASQTWAAENILINATEGGARFMGFEEMRLADVLEKYAQNELPIESWLDAGLKQTNFLDPKALGKTIQAEIMIIEKAAKAARSAEKEAITALKKLNSRQLGNLQPTLDRLARNEVRLQELTRQTRLLNSMLGVRIMALSVEPPAGNDKISITIHSVEKSRDISRLIIEGGAELSAVFKPLIANLLEA